MEAGLNPQTGDRHLTPTQQGFRMAGGSTPIPIHPRKEKESLLQEEFQMAQIHKNCLS